MTARTTRVLLAVAAVGASAATAWAHAELSRAEPVPDSVIAQAPLQVRLQFSEAVEATPDAIVVRGPDGARADGGNARARDDAPSRVEASLDARVQGTYAVEWHVLSGDGHPISGSYIFSVGAVSHAGPRAPAAAGRDAVLWQALGRFLHLCALVAMVGLPAFAMIVLRGPESAWQGRLWSYGGFGAPLFAAAALVMLAGQSLAFAGNLRLASLTALLATHWGWLWTGRLVLAVLLLAGSWNGAWGTRAGRLATLGLAAALLLLTSLNGHAAASEPVWLWLSLDWLHLAASVVWIGGLLALAFVVAPAIARTSESDRNSALVRVVPRFSTVALACVQVLLLTGVFATWAHVEGPAALTRQSYGQTLLVKWALVALAMLPAAVNLLVIRPRIAVAASAAGGRPAPARLFARLVAVEAGLAILVLAAAALLSALPPARRASPAPPPAPEPPTRPILTLTENVGDTLVGLELAGSEGTFTRFGVFLQDEQGGTLNAAQVRLRATPPEGSSEPVVSMRTALDGDRHRCAAHLGPPGRWTIEVLWQADGGREQTASFSLSLPAATPSASPR